VLDLGEPTALESETLHLLPGLLEGAWTRRVRLRALTLKAARVYRPTAQMDLFTTASPRREHDLKLAAVIDRLRREHGAGILMRGDELKPGMEIM